MNICILISSKYSFKISNISLRSTHLSCSLSSPNIRISNSVMSYFSSGWGGGWGCWEYSHSTLVEVEVGVELGNNFLNKFKMLFNLLFHFFNERAFYKSHVWVGVSLGLWVTQKLKKNVGLALSFRWLVQLLGTFKYQTIVNNIVKEYIKLPNINQYFPILKYFVY